MTNSIFVITTLILVVIASNNPIPKEHELKNQNTMTKNIKTELKFTIKIKAEAKTIFKAITTKKGYRGWWAKVCDVDCKINGVSSIRFEKPKVIEEMRFTTIDKKENEMLVWLCTDNNVFRSWVGNTLTFKINQEKGYCTFVFTQLNSDANWKTNQDYNGSEEGWDFFFQSLKEYCETGKGKPWG